MSSSNGLFPEIGSEIVDSLGAETQLFTKILHLLHNCKVSCTLNSYLHTLKSIVPIVMARTFEINFEKAHSMQVYVYMPSEE